MRLPVLFLAHGSPMNAVADNAFTRALSNLSLDIAPPRAVLMISAHWCTSGTKVTAMARPRTIHDFYGFPQELYAIEYPAPGSPELAQQLMALDPVIEPDLQWGLDHGAWSVLKFVFPQAPIPVVQLSLDQNQGSQFHWALGEKLRPLRDQGVLIVGSGNIVHNLRQISWQEQAEPFAWALQFDQWVSEQVESRSWHKLLHDVGATDAGRLSVPTREHFDPLLYILAASTPEDSLTWVYEGLQNRSISMRSLRLG